MSTEKVIDYKVVLADLIARRDQLNAAIAAIEAILGVIGPTGAQDAQPGMASIRLDEFFGMTVLDATKKYLGMMKDPQSTPDITNALQRGGYLFQTDKPVNTVTSVLIRDDARGGEVVRVGKGKFALAEWYSNRPKPKRQNEQNEEPSLASGNEETALSGDDPAPMLSSPTPLPIEHEQQ